MSEDIRQFQTKDERAGDELRRLLAQGPVRFQPTPTKETLEYLDRVDEVGRQPCRQPNLPKIPRVKLIPGSDPGYKTYLIPKDWEYPSEDDEELRIMKATDYKDLFPLSPGLKSLAISQLQEDCLSPRESWAWLAKYAVGETDD